MTVNVKDLDKEELLLTLYNHAKPLGMGFLQAKKGLMTKEEARKELDYSCKPEVCYIYDVKYPIACSYYK